MHTRFQRFVALRYLRGAEGRRKGRKFLRFITWLSISGVAVGVTALLLALSIARGFSSEIQKKIVSFGSHVQVDSYRDEPLSDAGFLFDKLKAFDGVTRVAPVVSEFALVRGKKAGDIDGVQLWGIDSFPPLIESQKKAGTLTFQADSSGMPGIVLGQGLARLLDVDVGDRVIVFSQAGGNTDSFTRPKARAFRITGTYETGIPKFDEIIAFLDIELARDMLGYGPDQVSRFDLMLDDIEKSRSLAPEIELSLGFGGEYQLPVHAASVYQIEEGMFAWINLQKQIIPLLISVIIIVAAFNLIGMLLMMILEKTPEIGILQSMGASPRKIRSLFVWLGTMIGFTGVLAGCLLSVALAVLQQQYQIIPLPVESYYMDSAPIELAWMDFLIVGSVAMILCLLASYIPARVAARIDPIRTIRFNG